MSWGCLGASCGGFFPSGGRLGGDVAYDVIFGVVSESFGVGCLWRAFGSLLETSWETFGVAWGPLGDLLGSS